MTETKKSTSNAEKIPLSGDATVGDQSLRYYSTPRILSVERLEAAAFSCTPDEIDGPGKNQDFDTGYCTGTLGS